MYTYAGRLFFRHAYHGVQVLDLVLFELVLLLQLPFHFEGEVAVVNFNIVISNLQDSAAPSNEQDFVGVWKGSINWVENDQGGGIWPLHHNEIPKLQNTNLAHGFSHSQDSLSDTHVRMSVVFRLSPHAWYS